MRRSKSYVNALSQLLMPRKSASKLAKKQPRKATKNSSGKGHTKHGSSGRLFGNKVH